MNSADRANIVSWLALIVSTGTLLCCALPIALVLFGFGAAVAAISSNFSFLTTLSLHKAWIFVASGGLLAVSGWLVYRPGRTCPPETGAGELCDVVAHGSQRVFRLSVAIWAIGFFAAYLALPLRIWFGV